MYGIKGFELDNDEDKLLYSLLLVLNMQVDGPEETQDSENPSTFTSIGVQVENDRGSVGLCYLRAQ